VILFNDRQNDVSLIVNTFPRIPLGGMHVADMPALILPRDKIINSSAMCIKIAAYITHLRENTCQEIKARSSISGVKSRCCVRESFARANAP